MVSNAKSQQVNDNEILRYFLEDFMNCKFYKKTDEIFLQSLLMKRQSQKLRIIKFL